MSRRDAEAVKPSNPVAAGADVEEKKGRKGKKKQRRLAMDASIAAIASHHCWVSTLETQGRDSLDFHNIAVWQLRDALIEAYKAGRRAARD